MTMSSVFCVCQSVRGSFNGSRLMIYCLMETFGQNAFDAMNLDPNVGRRNAGNIGHRLSIHALEIQEHQLPIERAKTMDQVRQTLERDPLLDAELVICQIGD